MSQAVDERADALVLDVIIVGAGQAGLAAGRFLQQAGVRFRLFDGAARVGDSWRRRYDSLVLFSPRSYSALPDMVMRGDPDGYPDKDEIASYLEQYADWCGLPVVLREGIAQLQRLGDHFIARTTRGRHVTARAVIVATGAFQRSVIPPWAVSTADCHLRSHVACPFYWLPISVRTEKLQVRDDVVDVLVGQRDAAAQ